MIVRPLLPRLVLVLSVIAAAIWVTVNRDQINLGTLNAWIAELGIWAPIGYVALYTLATVVFVSGAVFGLAGGALFGPLWGSAWNLLGATFGATLAFLTARYVAAGWVERKAGGRLKRLIDGVEAEGWRFVAFVRLVPLFPFNVSNYVLGLTRIPLRHYVVASFFCTAPGTVAYTWLGHAGRGALTGEADAIRYGLVALGLFAAIAVLPRLLRRMHDPLVWIEADALKRQLETGQPVTVIDVRGPDEFIGPLGHIPAARNMPISGFENQIGELAGLERTLVLVCRTDKRSAKAAKVLLGAGFARVVVLRGGMVQWHEDGMAVEGREVKSTASPDSML